MEVEDLIGGTPLLPLNRLGREVGLALSAKLEWYNPGGSVKDRPALWMIDEAERAGRLKSGDTLVEASTGNMGISMTWIGSLRGYRTIVHVPETASKFKIDKLRALGADIRFINGPSYLDEIQKDVREGAVFLDQMSNPANVRAHFESTGPEIWNQSGGRVDTLILGIGTGGTLVGTAKYLKSKNPDLRVVAVDPEGSVYSQFIKHGEIRPTEAPIRIEGVGDKSISAVFDRTQVDEIVEVSNADVFAAWERIFRSEGLCVGLSSALAVAGAVKSAHAKGRCVLIFPSSADAYFEKLLPELKRLRTRS